MAGNRVEHVAGDLRETVDEALPKLQKFSDTAAGEPREPGKWSRKEIIGHLIDSASNNHQRFIRAQQASMLSFPPYEQNHWSESQQCNARPWADPWASGTRTTCTSRTSSRAFPTATSTSRASSSRLPP